MQATQLVIHNFRSIEHCEITLAGYGLLIGANNSGKSNIIDAVRVFYEKGLKFDENRDTPKFDTSDEETWIEIEYKPSSIEAPLLKSEYLMPNGCFRVRKYLRSNEKDDAGEVRSGIYAYVSGKLSGGRFYGAKNVQQGKLGDIIYIPAVSRLDDHTKMTGPSVLRDLINAVLKKVIDKSTAYQALEASFETFEGQIKTEATEDGQSLAILETAISQEIAEWGTAFKLTVNPIAMDDIVKTLIGHQVHDKLLSQAQSPSAYGQGFQRHLIFSLIKVAATMTTAVATKKKKEFAPDFSWLLFEEPEAFLHPAQIDVLNSSLETLAADEGSQVTISTHNPQFVSRNTANIPRLARLHKDGPKTVVGQINDDEIVRLLTAYTVETQAWQAAGLQIDPEDLTVDMESIKVALWLDPRRCGAFFAKRVLLVEGPTETAAVSYLQDTKLLSLDKDGVFVLDTVGKFNIHRFMALLGRLKIPHSVLYDGDNGGHVPVVASINAAKNAYTRAIDSFPVDIEHYLGISLPKSPHRKPQHLLFNLSNGAISKSSQEALAKKLEKILT